LIRADANGFRIHFFGTPHFELVGAPFPFAGPPKALPLLAYLLLHRQAPLSRDAAAFALWPDDAEETARANLRRHLHMVQRALPPRADAAWILADGDSLRWNPNSPAWFDIAEFERCLKDDDLLPEAVALYRGELLENLYDDWIIEHRNRLRNAYLGALDRIVVNRRRSRDFHGAAEYAARMLVSDPWREDALRQLMSARYELGDRSGALQEFESFRRRLREEMEVDPMPETVALRDIILRGDPLPGPAATIELGPKPGRRETRAILPFVGRSAETAFLQEHWNRAVAGAGSLVLMGGEAGIGKSRLAGDFALAVEREGGRVLFGATSSPEGAPYQAVTDALRFALPLVTALRIEPVWLGAIAQLVPELRAQRSDIPPVQPSASDRDRLRLFESLAVTLAALARSRPLLLILEDLHWAGEATIAALEFLAPRFSNARILALATYRDDETPRTHMLRQLRHRLQPKGIADHLTPAPLGVEDLRTMLAAIPTLASEAESLAPMLLAQSEGNPLFAAEIARDWADSRPDVARIGEAPAVRAIIAARLARLSPDTRACAEIASVAGRGFDVDLVREVSGWPEDQVLRALDELVDRAIVRESSGRARYAFAFRHQLIQQTLYDAISPDVLVRRHRRTAHAIEELYAERRDELAADLARHYELGREPERAALWYLEAGKRAADVFAHAEAEAALTRGLALTQADEMRLEFVSMREACRNHMGDRSGQRTDIDEFERLADGLGDGDAKFDATLRRVRLERSLGERDREAAAITQLQRLAGDDRLKKARALLTAAEHASLLGQVELSMKQAAHALDLFGSRPDAVECLCLLAEQASHHGSIAEGRAYLDRARARAAEHSTLPLIARATMTAGTAALIQQRFAECIDLCVAAQELHRAMGDREGEADALGRQASAALRLFRFDEARRANSAAAAIFQAIGKRQGLALRRVNDCILAMRLGMFEQAREGATAAMALFEDLDDLRGRTVATVNLSALELWTGHLAAAKSLARKAIELARELKNPTMESAALANLGAAERDLGEVSEAIVHMEQGLALRRGISRAADNLQDLADLALGYVQARDLKRAQEVADEMIAAAEESTEGAMWPQYVFLAAAKVYKSLKKPARAGVLIARARAALEKFAAAVPDDAVPSFGELWFNREIATFGARAARARRRSGAR